MIEDPRALLRWRRAVDRPLLVMHQPALHPDTLTRLSVAAASEGADWIVWPESARPYVFYAFADRPDE